MNPGATTRPCASRVLLAALALSLPFLSILAIFPFLIPMSPVKRGVRVPSTTVPPWMTTSNSAMVCPPLLFICKIERSLRIYPAPCHRTGGNVKQNTELRRVESRRMGIAHQPIFPCQPSDGKQTHSPLLRAPHLHPCPVLLHS